MQPSNWAPEHSAALRDYLALGMSYSEIVKAINERFGTTYSRNAAIGRGKRMGLGGTDRPTDRPKPPAKAKAPSLKKLRQRRNSGPDAPAPEPESEPEFRAPTPAPGRNEPLKLRCVGITPRLLSLIELEPGDCRYPYGGDKEGEAIAFCGHPRLAGSSYCAPHFHLTRGDGTASERAAAPVLLRLVRAA
jgi:GcrA cell cycle regulator